MNYLTKSIELDVRDNEFCKRLKDPADPSVFHLEAFLPFSEVAKLDKGNANVRNTADRKPMKMMQETVESTPETFHRKNRGITYTCDRFSFDNATKKLTVTIPDISKRKLETEEAPTFGIADGGHTFEIVCRTMENLADLKKDTEWVEPYVRVHFMSGAYEIEQLVEALNTSIQVKQFTIDEYQGKFDELKVALTKAGFNIDLIAFRENEDEKDWSVTEVIQRLSCFLKERWEKSQPTSIYKSPRTALELYTNDVTHQEFIPLNDVIYDVVTFPEFIQSELSKGVFLAGRRLGKLRSVKTLRKPTTPVGTSFSTSHKMDMGALLPMAAAFRELLSKKGNTFYWRMDPKEVFRRCAADLYDALANRSSKVKSSSQLGSDTEYWTTCRTIVLLAKDKMREELEATSNS